MKKFLVVLATVFAVHADQGVKGGYRGHPARIIANATQGDSHCATTVGLCYKTVPYSSALISSTPHRSPTSGSVTILDCCDGYYRNAITGKCETSCTGGCYGGICTGNICTCSPGWRLEFGICVPVCAGSCKTNAYCVGPDLCKCQPGYELVGTECKPHCPGGCNNGDCILPGVCRCKLGYTLTDENECVATCSGGCLHGSCAAPNVCTCSAGYINPPGQVLSCVPHCPNGCNGGTCTAPGLCSCRPGFVIDHSGQCVAPTVTTTVTPTGTASCQRPCLNAVCSGYNTCTCRSGYVRDPTDPYESRCIPSCPAGCINGVCSAPNFCICKAGFVKDNSVKGVYNKCIPRY